jgi:RsiW-degrading membrane proteinase PrsW (M82 family)
MPAHIGTIWGLRVRTAVRLAGALIALVLLAFWLELGTGALAAGIVLAIAPVPVYTMLALWLDRYDPEPTRLLLKAFAWGAIVAVSFSLVVNEWVAFITGSDLARSVAAAPFGEEVSKAVALALLFHFQRHDFDNITDGVVYATMIGLGFATTENIYYYGSAFVEGLTDEVFLLRGAVTPFAHPLFTSMTGIGIGWARESDNPNVRAFAPVGGLALAIALHALWNASAQAGAFFPVYLITMAPAFLAVLLVVRRSLLREETILRRFLRRYVAEGALSPAQLDEICASWSGARAIRRRLLARDEDLHLVAIELAFHRWRSTRDSILDAAAHAAREELLAARLREYSGAFAGDPGVSPEG